VTVAADRQAVPFDPGVAAACVPGWSERPARTAPHTIGVLLGEGIGPEVVGAALTVLDAVGDAFGLEFDIRTSDALAPPGPHGRRLDPGAADFFDALFAVEAPAFCGAVSGRFVYELRAHFELYCKLVPVRPLAVLADASIVRPERLGGVDVMIVRDNIGGLYHGGFGRRDGGRVAYQEAVYDADQVDRLLDVALRAATARRGRLAVITKSGGIPELSALWRERAHAAAAESEVVVDELEVDNACFQLVADPRRFDVVAAPNMLGDIVSDTAAQILGSRGMALSANYGAGGRAVYQTGHGAAYDLAGTDTANPVAQIQSLAMLLRESLGLPDAARAVEEAVIDTLATGVRTADVAGPDSTVVGTRALTERIAANVSNAATPLTQ
jgi:3-isopropylmalate dehydrogenase